MKDSIEEEKKIQDELRIKFMDFCVDEKIMNFIEPQPDKLPAMEQVRNDRFSIQQLSTLITELEELAKEFGDGAGKFTKSGTFGLLIGSEEDFCFDEGPV